METLVKNLERQLDKMKAIRDKADNNYYKYSNQGRSRLANVEYNKSENISLAMRKLQDSIHYLKNSMDHE